MAEAWEEERSHLLPLPPRPWPCCTRLAKATLSCLVSFDGNRYSVPAAYAGRQRDVDGGQSPTRYAGLARQTRK